MEANNSKDFSIDFFLRFFLMETIFKVFIEFLLFYASVLCFSVLAKSHMGS